MFKKVSLLVISVLFASSSYAANSGFYVGADVGRDTGTFKDDENQVSATTDIKYQTALAGYDWGAHIGYDFFLSQHAVLGAQVFFDQSSAHANASGGRLSNVRQFKKKGSVGFDLMPGIQLNDANRLYGILGVVRTSFDQTNNFPAQYGPAFTGTKRNGVQLGAGYQVNLAKQWTANVNYIHSDYRAIHNTSSDGNYTYKPVFDTYDVGVNYYFANATTLSNDTSHQLNTQGWYVGGALGMMNARIEQGYIDLSNQQNNINYPYGMRGALANGHAGYRWQLERYVVGVEGFAQGETTKMDYAQPTSSVNQDFKFRENWSWGLSVLPGIKITPSNLLYLRVGSIYSKFSNYGSTVLQPLFNETQTGLQTGLGWETAVAEHFSIFGEYDHAQYAKIVTPDSFNSGVETYKLSDDQYKLGVNYSF